MDPIRWNLISTVLAETCPNLDKFRQRQAPYENAPATMYYLNNSTTGIAYYSSYYQTFAIHCTCGVYQREVGFRLFKHFRQ